MSKQLFGEVKLYPTLFVLDVFIGWKTKDFLEYCQKRYGTPEEDNEPIENRNFVTHIGSTLKSEMKGETRILVVLDKFDNSTVIHEIMHIIFRVADFVKLEITSDAQEWVACMAEMIYDGIKAVSKTERLQLV